MWSRTIQEAVAACVWLAIHVVLVSAGWLALPGGVAGNPDQNAQSASEESSEGQDLTSLPVEILTKPVRPSEPSAVERTSDVAIAEPVAESQEEAQEMWVSNAIEPHPMAVARLTPTQVEEQAHAYNADIERNGAVLILRPSGQLSPQELGDTFLLKDEQGKSCGTVASIDHSSRVIQVAEQRADSLTGLRDICGQRLETLEIACEQAPQRMNELQTLCSDLAQKISMAKEMKVWMEEATDLTEVSNSFADIERSLHGISDEIDGEIVGLSTLLTIQNPHQSSPSMTNEDLIGSIERTLGSANYLASSH